VLKEVCDPSYNAYAHLRSLAKSFEEKTYMEASTKVLLATQIHTDHSNFFYQDIYFTDIEKKMDTVKANKPSKV